MLSVMKMELTEMEMTYDNLDKQTNRQTDKQTNRQTDKQTNRQTDKHILMWQKVFS